MPANSILVGLVGAGIQASLTPRLHEDEGAAQGLRYQYRLIDLDVLGLMPAALPEILAKAEHDGFTGLNITYPCKQAVIALLDELSPDARAIGAVNTVVFRNGRRLGRMRSRRQRRTDTPSVLAASPATCLRWEATQNCLMTPSAISPSLVACGSSRISSR